MVGVVVLLTGIAGYVYSHEPARDTLLVEFEGTPAPQPTYITGSFASVEDALLRVDTAAGRQHEVPSSADLPVEDLRRLPALPSDGATVNVGVDDTSFGQVLTGVVIVEGAP